MITKTLSSDKEILMFSLVTKPSFNMLKYLQFMFTLIFMEWHVRIRQKHRT